MTQAQVIIVKCGKIHPLDAWDAFGWTINEAAYFLNISPDSLRAYRRKRLQRPGTTRTPRDSTEEQVWYKCKTLLEAGMKPVRPQLLPSSILEYAT